MNPYIAPSILAADMSCLGDEIQRAVDGGCDAFHLDIMDYHFVPNLSFGPGIVSTLRRLTDLPLDVHLMVDNPFDMIVSFADAGSDYLTIHTEVVDDVPEALGRITDCGVKPGLTLKPDTPIEAVIPYIGLVDILLIMSVYPGFGGQKFLESTYERCEKTAMAAKDIGSAPFISVDGGVDMTNARLLAESGANYLVAGTSIFRDHKAAENIVKLRELLGR